MNGHSCTKYFDPRSPFSSPSQKAKITFRSRVAARYIASLLKEMGIRPLGESYYQPFDAYRKERQQKGRLEVHPDSIAKLKQVVHQKLSMNNVLGMIPGKKTNEYVIVGAHFDHLGIDPALDGDQIYNGADDNSSRLTDGYPFPSIAKRYTGQLHVNREIRLHVLEVHHRPKIRYKPQQPGG